MVAASYEIHIKGRISDQLMSAFEGLDATVGPVETVPPCPGIPLHRPRTFG